MPDSKIIVIVPCYNEEKRLDVESFLIFLEAHSSYYFVFVNDGSRDGTLSVLKKMADRNQRIRVLNLRRNSGKAEAIRQGILQGLDLVPEVGPDASNFFAYYDADQATPLSELNRICERLKGVSDKKMALASRVQLLGLEIARKPMRHYLGRIFATAASLVLRLAVYDTQCGTKVFCYEKTLLEIFRHPFLTRWLFDVELLKRYCLQVGVQGVKDTVIEVPLQSWKDVAGSRLRPWDFIKAPWELFKIYWYYHRN